VVVGVIYIYMIVCVCVFSDLSLSFSPQMCTLTICDRDGSIGWAAASTFQNKKNNLQQREREREREKEQYDLKNKTCHSILYIRCYWGY